MGGRWQAEGGEKQLIPADDKPSPRLKGDKQVKLLKSLNPEEMVATNKDLLGKNLGALGKHQRSLRGFNLPWMKGLRWLFLRK